MEGMNVKIVKRLLNCEYFEEKYNYDEILKLPPDKEIQEIMESKEYTRLATNPRFNMKDLKELNGWVDPVIDYIKDYVSLNAFA